MSRVLFAPTQARGAHISAAQATFERALLDEGVTVDHKSDAIQALRRFSSDEHDLVLLGHDDAVPEAALQTLSREIHALRARLREEGRRPPHVPVLLLSSAAEAGAQQAARLLSADDVVGLGLGHHQVSLQMMCARVRAYLALAQRGLGRGVTPSPRPVSGPGPSLFRHDAVMRLVHDLRNPLAGLSSNLAYLDERLAELGDGEVSEALADSRAAVARLRRAATMLVDVGPLEEGTLRPRRSETAIEPLVIEVLQQRQHEATLRDQRLLLDVPRGLTLPCDQELVQRLLHALLDHALRYAQSKTPVLIDVRAVEDQGGGRLRLRVVAQGEWIPHAERLVGGRSSAAEVGLGLHYAVLVARAHGGALEVQSTAEAGKTTALLTL